MEKRFQLLPGVMQVSLGQGEEPEEIVPVLSAAAEFAREKCVPHLLVVSGDGDPATAESVSMALEQIHALGAPLPERIAFVAYTLPQYSVYHFAERYAQRFGIAAKVLVSVRDAKDWLGLREAPAPVRGGLGADPGMR
jgi:hypothetical protein